MVLFQHLQQKYIGFFFFIVSFFLFPVVHSNQDVYQEAQNLFQKGQNDIAKQKIISYIEDVSFSDCKGYSLLSKIDSVNESYFKELFRICEAFQKSSSSNPLFLKKDSDLEKLPPEILPYYLYFGFFLDLGGLERKRIYLYQKTLDTFLLSSNSGYPFSLEITGFNAYLRNDSKTFGQILEKIQQNPTYISPIFYLLEGHLNKSFSFEKYDSYRKLPNFTVYSYDFSMNVDRYGTKIIPKNPEELKLYLKNYKRIVSLYGDYLLYADIIPLLSERTDISDFLVLLEEIGGASYAGFIKDLNYSRRFSLEQNSSIAIKTYPLIFQTSLRLLEYYSKNKQLIELGFSPASFYETELFFLFDKILYLRSLNLIVLEESFLETIYTYKDIFYPQHFQVYQDDEKKIFFNPRNIGDKEKFLLGKQNQKNAEMYHKYYSGSIASGSIISQPSSFNKIDNTASGTLNQNGIYREKHSFSVERYIYIIMFFLSFIGFFSFLFLLKKKG